MRFDIERISAHYQSASLASLTWIKAGSFAGVRRETASA
jgi:hypothetical protein